MSSFSYSRPLQALPSSPTRPSSDLFDLSVVPREEDVRDTPAPELRRARVVRVLETAAELTTRARRSSGAGVSRSEEHTSELQSLTNLVCRLLLEKKKNRC